MESLLQLILELLLQGGAELLLEIIFHLIDNEDRQHRRAGRHPVWGAIFCAVLGTLVGFVSVAAWPQSFIHAPELRIANLVVTPLLLGLFMMLVGRRREKRGDTPVALDRFTNAALFAFAMAMVRFCLTK
jgi:hypothetical protein